MQTNNNINFNNIKLTSPDELFKKVTPSNASEIKSIKISKDSLSINSKNNKGIPILNGLNLNNEVSSKPKDQVFNITNISSFNNSSSSEILNLPARKTNSISGSQFLKLTSQMNRFEREEAILNEVLSGNVPDFVRNMKTISFNYSDKNGKNYNVKFNVLPDYLAIGSNNDFVRIPMSPITAQKIAYKTGTNLPTKKIVDIIYSKSEKLTPEPMQAGSSMMSNQYYKEHNDKIEKQKQNKGFDLNTLISGHKKDIVISNRLDEKPNRVAIYGWHKNDGKAIQPLSIVHEDTYADYSHGARLISNKVNINGQEYKLKDVLKSPELSKIFSDEGIINNTVIKI